MRSFLHKRLCLVAALIGAACLASPAGAQTATPAKPAAKARSAAKVAKKPSASVTVEVTNSRGVALTELDATPSGLYFPKAIVKNLAPGKKTTANVATDKDCVYDLHGIFADDSTTDSTSVDICKDNKVNLTEEK